MNSKEIGEFMDKHVLIIGGQYDGIITDPKIGDEFDFEQAFTTKSAYQGSSRAGIKINGELYTRTHISKGGMMMTIYVHHSLDELPVTALLFLSYKRLKSAAPIFEIKAIKDSRDRQDFDNFVETKALKLLENK